MGSSVAGAGPAGVPEGWTQQELDDLRQSLLAHNADLSREIDEVTAEIDDLTADAATATGDDQADTGSRAFERDHALQMVLNARDLLDQNQRALARIEQGRFGICESCGELIAKGRLQAHPGATLCVSCKAKRERR